MCSDTLSQELKTIPVLIYESALHFTPTDSTPHIGRLLRLAQYARIAADNWVYLSPSAVKDLSMNAFSLSWFVFLVFPKLLLYSGKGWDGASVLADVRMNELMDHTHDLCKRLRPHRDVPPGPDEPKEVFWFWEQWTLNVSSLLRRYMSQRDAASAEKLQSIADFRSSVQEPDTAWRPVMEPLPA